MHATSCVISAFYNIWCLPLYTPRYRRRTLYNRKPKKKVPYLRRREMNHRIGDYRLHQMRFWPHSHHAFCSKCDFCALRKKNAEGGFFFDATHVTHRTNSTHTTSILPKQKKTRRQVFSSSIGIGVAITIT